MRHVWVSSSWRCSLVTRLRPGFHNPVATSAAHSQSDQQFLPLEMCLLFLSTLCTGAKRHHPTECRFPMSNPRRSQKIDDQAFPNLMSSKFSSNHPLRTPRKLYFVTPSNLDRRNRRVVRQARSPYDPGRHAARLGLLESEPLTGLAPRSLRTRV